MLCATRSARPVERLILPVSDDTERLINHSLSDLFSENPRTNPQHSDTAFTTRLQRPARDCVWLLRGSSVLSNRRWRNMVTSDGDLEKDSCVGSLSPTGRRGDVVIAGAPTRSPGRAHRPGDGSCYVRRND